VLDAAAVPERKSYPARGRFLMVGALFSLFAACLFVLIAQLWENTDSQDERKLLLTEIGGTVFNALHRASWPLGKRWAHARETE